MRGEYKTGTYPAVEIANGTQLEKERFTEWSKNHPCPNPLTLHITSTQIGFGVDVVCTHCGAQADITDYLSW